MAWHHAPVLLSMAAVLLAAGCGAGSTRDGAGSATAPSLPTLDPSLVDEGRQIYARNCASCHGANAEGAPNWQQPDARGDLPPPPHDDSGHTWRHGDGELFMIVRDGWRDPFNQTTDLTMPAFGEMLSDDQIQAVITYLKSLWSEEQRRFQLEESQDQPFPTPTGGTP